MAHRHDVYRYGPGEKYIEHEFKCAGRYGAKGEKRAPKKKATPEQIKKQNQWSREKKVLRKIRGNFEQGDLWITLKLPKGTQVEIKWFNKAREKLQRKLREEYRKRNQDFKFMYREEIGERGGAHIHFIMNRINGSPGTAELVSKIWKELTGGNVNYTPLYEEGDYKELANYLVKPAKEEISGQLTLFGTEEEKKVFSRYGCSKNLKEPEKETHVYKRRTIRKLVENGPEPEEGYYIDKNSIRYGVNPFTGMTYYYYTEIRLGEQREDRWKDGGGG